MLIRPSNRVLEALSKLEHDARFKDVKDWLEQSLNETYSRLASTNEEIELRQQQGSARTLKELIDVAENARSILKK